MANTPRLDFPIIEEGTVAAETVHANSLFRQDKLVQMSIIEKNLNTEAPSPAPGDTYHIGTVPTGAWVGHAGELAYWNGEAWLFTPLLTGMNFWDQTVLDFVIWNGTTFIELLSVAATGLIRKMHGGIEFGSGAVNAFIGISYEANIEIVDSTGLFKITPSGTSGQVDTSVSGVVNGLDTGSVAANTAYYVYAIKQSGGSQLSGFLMSTSPTTPNLAWGTYDLFKRVFYWPTDSASFPMLGRGHSVSGFWTMRYAETVLSATVATATNTLLARTTNVPTTPTLLGTGVLIPNEAFRSSFWFNAFTAAATNHIISLEDNLQTGVRKIELPGVAFFNVTMEFELTVRSNLGIFWSSSNASLTARIECTGWSGGDV